MNGVTTPNPRSPTNGTSEGAPLVCQWIQIDHVFDRAEALNLVVVDDDDQVVQFVVWREQRGFPNRTFVTLAVADHAEDAGGSAIPLCSNGHPGGDGKPVAQ